MPYSINGVWQEPKPEITVWRDDNNFLVVAPYNKQYLEAVKRTIPSQDRKWNRIHKGWVIHLDYLRDVKSLLFRHF